MQIKMIGEFGTLIRVEYLFIRLNALITAEDLDFQGSNIHIIVK